MDVHKKKLV